MCGETHGLIPVLNSFLEGPKAALVASKDFDDGHYKTTPQHGLRAFGRVYSAWAYGQTVTFSPKIFFWYFFTYFCYSGSGNISTFTMDGKSNSFFLVYIYSKNPKWYSYPNLDAFLREEWEHSFYEWDANDLLTLLNTWKTGDVSKVRDGGDLNKCLSQIKAKGLIMPSKSDLYFPVSWSTLRTFHSLFIIIIIIIIISIAWRQWKWGGGNEKYGTFGGNGYCVGPFR